jgi:hypothetical protein
LIVVKVEGPLIARDAPVVAGGNHGYPELGGIPALAIASFRCRASQLLALETKQTLPEGRL